MSQEQVITGILGIQGWEIIEGGVREESGCWIISICPVAGSVYECPECGERYLIAYDHSPMRRIRDFPMRGMPCFLELQLPRVSCMQCGVLVARQTWVEPMQRLTTRYERFVAMLCDLMPVMDVADFEGLDKDTVYRLDRKWLEWRKRQRKEHPVRKLGIDEIAIRKGCRFATVFYDLERREVLGLIPGRSERAVNRFFKRQGKAWCKGIEAVCMDLWRAYMNGARRYCRNAAIVFDKFHVYTYLSDAIDEVRRVEQTKADEENKDLLKGCRWLLLRPFSKVRGHKRINLEEVLRMNKNIFKAHLLKEDFTQFYNCANATEAQNFLAAWTHRCKESQLAPFVKLAKRLNRWAHGILAYFTHRITNGVSEGINNVIKVIKRRSYGFHDMEYFFLKILAKTGSIPPLTLYTHSFAE